MLAPLTSEETREAMRLAHELCAANEDDRLIVSQPEADNLARLVLLLIERGKRMANIFALSLAYARAARLGGAHIEHMALRAAALDALALEEQDEVTK